MFFFFFKQKTAYEMRISDWSSDVCSSDLENAPDVAGILDRLSMLIPIAPEEKERILEEIRRKKKFVPVTVREFLEWEDVARIDRKSVVEGKRVSVRVELGGRR